MASTIKFDNTEIRNTTYTPRFVKHETIPEKIISTEQLARGDGEIIVSERYGKRIISFVGILSASSQANLETAIDSFKELFSRQQKNLDIDWAGGTLRYVATCVNHRFDRDHFHNLFVPWSAEFAVYDSFGEDTTETVLVNAENFNSGRWTKAFTFAGSAKPRPRFTLTPAATAANTQGLMIKNTDNGQRIVVPFSGGLLAVDYEIDCRLKTVKINGVVSKYYGQFPDFIVGVNNIIVEIGKVVDQEFNPTAHSGHFPIYGTRKGAQSFTVSEKDITYMGLALSMTKIGTLNSGHMDVEIQPDVNGEPSGTPVTNAEFQMLCVDVQSSPSESFVFMFTNSRNKFTLEANTTYWIVVDGSAVGDVSNYLSWCVGLNSEATYKRGSALEDTTGSWAIPAGEEDYLFKLYFMGNQFGNTTAGTVKYYKRHL